MSNIKNNLGYQTIYEVLNTCIPLITAPYLARVLGSHQLGVFSFTQSIVNYFVLVAMLGVKNYGTRAIAKARVNRKECECAFNEIFSLQLISSLVAMILYVTYCMLLCKDNYLIAYIQMIAIASCVIDINWLFAGMENFKVTVQRSIVVRVFTVILIFILVKTPDDLWIYTMLMVGGTFVGNIILWKFLPQMIGRVQISIKGIRKHIKPNIILFVPLMAMSVYHLMDKTMLGWLSSYEQTGFYYNADKIINIPVGILVGVGTVMLPRITNMIITGKENEAEELFLTSIEGLSVVSFAMVFGIIAIAKDFVPFFFGQGYDECISLVIVLAPVLYVKAMSLTVRNEYLIPYNLDSIFVYSVIIGALVNIVVNVILIPKYGAMGAVIGTLVAESIACLWQIIAIRKRNRIVWKILKCSPYLLIGLIMAAIVRLIGNAMICAYVYKLIIEVVIGGIVFFGLCFLFWRITNNSMMLIFTNALKKKD